MTPHASPPPPGCGTVLTPPTPKQIYHPTAEKIACPRTIVCRRMWRCHNSAPPCRPLPPLQQEPRQHRPSVPPSARITMPTTTTTTTKRNEKGKQTVSTSTFSPVTAQLKVKAYTQTANSFQFRVKCALPLSEPVGGGCEGCNAAAHEGILSDGGASGNDSGLARLGSGTSRLYSVRRCRLKAGAFNWRCQSPSVTLFNSASEQLHERALISAPSAAL